MSNPSHLPVSHQYEVACPNCGGAGERALGPDDDVWDVSEVTTEYHRCHSGYFAAVDDESQHRCGPRCRRPLDIERCTVCLTAGAVVFSRVDQLWTSYELLADVIRRAGGFADPDLVWDFADMHLAAHAPATLTALAVKLACDDLATVVRDRTAR